MAGGPDYTEARLGFTILRVFTPSDLADLLGTDTELASRFIHAGCLHGILTDLDVSINGSGPAEGLYEWKELPPGPTHHFTREPEWKSTPGCYELAPRNRGLPVRLVDNTKRRDMMQGTGGARLRVKNRDRAYERMMEAIEKRAQKNRMKERLKHEDPLHKRRHRGDLPE
jgi:hypothetical protein